MTMTWQELEREVTKKLNADLTCTCPNPALYKRMREAWDKWCDEHVAAHVRLSAKNMGMHQRYGSVSPFTNLLAILNKE